LKKNFARQTWRPYRQTKSGELTFDTLSTEDSGYYICQAQVKGDFVETNEVNVQGSTEPLFHITRQPRSQVVAEGSAFKLRCRAEFKPGIECSLCYQWFHNNTAIRGATSFEYGRSMAGGADTGNYHCRVSDGQGGQSILTESVTVALAHKSEETTNGDSGFRSLHQLRQIEGII
jgi:hypothetical protein